MDKEEVLQYWLDSSDSDLRAMEHLFEKGDFTWSLFLGHIVLEKLLKAWYVKHIDITPPFIHDLVRLAKKAGLELDENQKDLFDTVTTFNLRARYDDYRRDFFRKCTPGFTEKWLNEIKALRQWLKNGLQK